MCIPSLLSSDYYWQLHSCTFPSCGKYLMGLLRLGPLQIGWLTIGAASGKSLGKTKSCVAGRHDRPRGHHTLVAVAKTNIHAATLSAQVLHCLARWVRLSSARLRRHTCRERPPLQANHSLTSLMSRIQTSIEEKGNRQGPEYDQAGRYVQTQSTA